MQWATRKALVRKYYLLVNELTKFREGIQRVAKASAAAASAVTKNSVPVFLQLGTVLGIIFGIGLGLILLRTGLIASAPSISKHAKLFAAWATVVQDIFVAIEDFFIGIIFVIRIVVDALKQNPTTPNAPKFHTFHDVSADAVDDFAHRLIECGEIRTHESFVFITRSAANTAVCPVLRAATPMRWINTTVLPHFGWLAFSYAPQPQTTGDLDWSNCEPPDPDYVSLNELCAALRAGNIIVELALPVAISVILIATTAPQFVVLMAVIAELAWTVAEAFALRILKLV